MSDAALIIDEFRNILSIIVIELVITLPFMEKRKYFIVRLAGSLAVCLSLAALYVYLHKFLAGSSQYSMIALTSVMWYTGILLLAGGLAFFCFKMNLTELVWIMITAYAAQHVVYVVVNEFIVFGLLKNKINIWLQLLMYIGFAALIYFIMYKLFIPNIRMRKHLYITHNWLNCLVLCVLLVIFLTSAFVNQSNAVLSGTELNYLSVASDFINCALVIVVQYVSLRNSRIKTEKETLQLVLDAEKQQYETFKNAVDYINIKCHDLKHEISAMQREGKINSKRLDEVTENIAIYESFVKTGNETLDILLTDKNLICIGKGISLSCIADASGFSNMEATDIYALFGNLLDNAIEFVSGLEDKEKRFIRLFIKSQGNLKIVHQENYFEGRLTFIDGLPQTTKGDNINHGFGTKSMRKIASKYNGEISMSAADNLFKVDIVLTE